MASLLKFGDLKNRIDWAARKARTSSANTRTPILLEAICEELGIQVEWRRMIPEGVMAASPSGLTIYLQNNFRDDPSYRRRLRFTFAHEICHALFYDGLSGTPRPLAGMPKGAALEKLCQQGAGYLLVPTELLPTTLTVSSADEFSLLANAFDVSMDVLMRRVHDVNRLLPEEYVVLLIRRREHALSIDALAYRSLPYSRLRLPEIGEDFNKWSEPAMLGMTETGPNGWIKTVGEHRLELRRTPRWSNSELVEIQRTSLEDPAKIEARES